MTWLAMSAICAVAAAATAGGEVSVASAPPVVVRTVPEAGAVGVDPKTTELRVTFSKAMVDKSWSWNKVSASTFPKLAGQPRYESDKRTCVLPVKLERGRTYAVWVNTPAANNFRDVSGHPAVPYLLIFETRGPTGATETSNDVTNVDEPVRRLAHP